MPGRTPAWAAGAPGTYIVTVMVYHIILPCDITVVLYYSTFPTSKYCIHIMGLTVLVYNVTLLLYYIIVLVQQ